MCGAQNEKTISFTHEEDGELYDCEAVLAYEATSGKSNLNLFQNVVFDSDIMQLSLTQSLSPARDGPRMGVMQTPS